MSKMVGLMFMHLRVRGRQEPTSHLPPIFLFSFPRKITHLGPCRRNPTHLGTHAPPSSPASKFSSNFPLDKRIALSSRQSRRRGKKKLILAMGGIEPPSGRRCWTTTSTTTHATTTPHHLSLSRVNPVGWIQDLGGHASESVYVERIRKPCCQTHN
jgi:hypothetical protein